MLITLKAIQRVSEDFNTHVATYKEVEIKRESRNPLSTIEPDFKPEPIQINREQDVPILQNIFKKDNIQKSIEREFRRALNSMKGNK